MTNALHTSGATGGQLVDLSPWQRKLADWITTRAELRAIEETEHPDIVDHFGRAWVWRSGDLYAHDQTLALTASMIDEAGLPPATLATNPNYYRLCAICTAQWTEEERAQLARTVQDHRKRFGEDRWPSARRSGASR